MDDLRTLCEKYSDLDVEYKFASISDDLWKLGSIDKIKDEVSPETFTFHVAVNMIGNWKGDGWDFIFYEVNTVYTICRKSWCNDNNGYFK